MAETRYPLFVWIKGLRGPTCEIWYQQQMDGFKAKVPLQSHWIPEGVSRNFDTLETLFPYKGEVH